MQSDHQQELMSLKGKHHSELSRKETEHAQEITRLKKYIAWQSHIIGCLSFLLLKTSDIFRKAVHSVIRLARDYYKTRFDTEQVSDIKSALNMFGDDKQSHHAAGDFLFFTAKKKGGFDNREQIKARREVDNVVEGNYDQQQKKRIFDKTINCAPFLIKTENHIAPRNGGRFSEFMRILYSIISTLALSRLCKYAL